MPDAGQLEELLRMLLGPERERDEAAAEAVLEMHGVDPAEADEALRRRLEREVEERRVRGEQVPQAILDALANQSLDAETHLEMINLSHRRR
ncbi:MAG: hypothetical protein M3444_02545 [Acidobacteriota bacterium]|nr:hypothetical protein [Acidobacteriota bacterium]